MGKTIERLAQERGHTIAGIIDKDNYADLAYFDATRADVAIEFTEPTSAMSNITRKLLREPKLGTLPRPCGAFFTDPVGALLRLLATLFQKCTVGSSGVLLMVR